MCARDYMRQNMFPLCAFVLPVNGPVVVDACSCVSAQDAVAVGFVTPIAKVQKTLIGPFDYHTLSSSLYSVDMHSHLIFQHFFFNCTDPL